MIAKVTIRNFTVLLLVCGAFACGSDKKRRLGPDERPRSHIPVEGEDRPPSAGSSSTTPNKSQDIAADAVGDFENHAVDSDREYTTEHILEAGELVLDRFRRLRLLEGEILNMRTWKEDSEIWAALSYVRSKSVMQVENIYLACHFHNQVLGCHQKPAPGAGDPN